MMIVKLKQYTTSHLKTIIILIWITLTFIQTISITNTGPTLGVDTGLDDSWIMSLPQTFQQGYISGRDFQFTYGPLWQFLCWLVAFGNNSKTSFDDYGLILLFFHIGGVPFIGLLVGLIKQVTWKYALFFFTFLTILHVRLFFVPLKCILGILVCLLLSRVLERVSLKERLIGSGIVGFCCFLGQLLILDLGVFTLASCLGILLIYSVLPRFSKRVNKVDLLSSKSYLQMFGVLLGVFLVSNLLISFIFLLTSPNYPTLFHYQVQSWETLRGYSFTMGLLEWGLPLSNTVLFILIIIYTIALSIYLWWKLPTKESYFIACVLPFCLVSIRGGTVRSEAGHIIISLLPLIILLALLGADWLKKGQLSLHWCTAVLLLLIAFPGSNFQAFNQLMTWAEGKSSLSTKLTTLTTRQTPPSKIVTAEMIAALDPDKTTLSFPSDNYIPIGLNQKIIAPVLQTYAAFTPTLQEAYVDQLERHKSSLQVIYGMDGIATGGLEGVPAISRVPYIFEYLYRNFEAKYPKLMDRGYLILKPRSSSVSLEGESLVFENKVSSKEFKLAKPATCSIVRLQLKINYPITINFGRPTHLKLSFFDSGKLLTQANIVPLEPGKEFSTYFSLMDADQFQNIFITGTSVQSKQWDSLTFEPIANAFLDVSPSSVVVNKLECMEFNLRP